MIGYLVEQELGNLLPVRAAARDPAHDGRGRPRRPGLRRPDQVRRADLRRGARREPLAAEKGWVVKPDGAQLAAGRAVARARSASSRSGRCAGCWSTARSSSAPAAAASRRCTPRTRTDARRRRGGHRQGPREQPAGPRARRRPVRHGDRRRRRLRGLGHADAGDASTAITPAELDAMDFPAGSMGPKVAAATEFVGGDRQAGRDRLARRDRGLVAGRRARNVVPEKE